MKILLIGLGWFCIVISVIVKQLPSNQYPKFEFYRFISTKCLPSGTQFMRKWLNDTTFMDMRLGQNCFYSSDTFILKNSTWSYLRHGIHFPYFSKSRFIAKDTITYYRSIDFISKGKIYGQHEDFIPLKEDTLGGKKVFIYEGDERQIFFDPEIGIVREDHNLCSFRLSKGKLLNQFTTYHFCE